LHKLSHNPNNTDRLEISFKGGYFMDYFMDTLDVVLRSVLSLAFLFFITRLMGRKQISQLSFFDYIIGISIGSIASEMATGLNTPYLHGFVAIGIYGFIATGISLLTNKNMKLRRFVNGRAYVLIEKGKILNLNLAKVKYDINDLLSEARFCGYFDIADIEFAIMETSGRVSFLPKSNIAPVTLEDMKIEKEQQAPVANIIIDGKVMDDNLKTMGLDETWLKKQLVINANIGIEEIILATVNKNNEIKIFKKTENLINKYQLD